MVGVEGKEPILMMPILKAKTFSFSTIFLWKPSNLETVIPMTKTNSMDTQS